MVNKRIVVKVRPSQTWELHRLKPHPKQSLYFPRKATDAEIQSLAEDIKRNGLRERIEILPDGTIISGHTRCRAVGHLGRAEVDVTVRYDLHRQGKEAVERRLIEANMNRRQLTQLEQVRLAKAILALSRDGSGRRRKGWVMDEVGRSLGLSGKHLQRLLVISELPRAVQSALENRSITQGQCLALAKRDQATIEAVAHKLEHGGSAKMVVSEVLRGATSPIHDDDHLVATKMRKLLLLGRELIQDPSRVRLNAQPDWKPQIEELAAFLLTFVRKKVAVESERLPRSSSLGRPV